MPKLNPNAAGESEGPFSRAWGGMALGIVAFIAVAAVGVSLFAIFHGSGGDKKPTTAPTKAPTPSASASSSAKPASSSACGLPDGPQTQPTKAPAATWRFTPSANAYPVNPTYGPGKTLPGGLPTCYAHNPTGALFAAATALPDMLNPKVTPAELAQRMVPSGPGVVKILQRRNTSGGFELAGYQIVDATKNRATVSLVVKATTGKAAGQPMTTNVVVVWKNGDWRFSLAQSVRTFQPLGSWSSYTKWSGA